ncbi:type VI secretion system baseplate subunit TssE [Enterovibrio sp. ZSDZ35]|uniref:Type VI secretion system baseplate subunit TssE n=1 Tax=Enterovibrio qingdaonensis TaxID=2899818 RepID=A0ABT5QHP3_9GAMM|nr:type VI secretion system baseplate subunit TssE [Enterovibrio sp. ZSDZ35]MDD1780503.1 type VI secretion system baseplate subunit TssE [Enterovibrio sp. ZSDZ35]
MAIPDADDTAFGVSLFQRMDTGFQHSSYIQGPATEDVLASLKLSVSNLLNARVGEALSAPELGLIDFNDASLSSHDLAIQIKRAITRCIRLYEPRIQDMEILVLPDESSPLNLRFQIAASVNVGAMHRNVRIDLLLDSNRKYRVT